MRNLASGVKSAVTALGVVLVCAVVLMLLVATLLVGLGSVVGHVGNLAGSSSGETPAAFGVGETDGQATVVHEGGEELPADQLLVGVGEEDRGTWAEHDGTTETVSEGDSITIDDVDDGEEITLHELREGGAVELHSETV